MVFAHPDGPPRATAIRRRQRCRYGPPIDAQLLLRRAVEARIEAWNHPFIDERDEAAGEVGLMLQDVVREQLPRAIPAYASIDGMKELSAHTSTGQRLYVLGAFYLVRGNHDLMLPVEADLSIEPGAASTVRVGGEESVFELPTGERQFVRRMENVRWRHRLDLRLA